MVPAQEVEPRWVLDLVGEKQTYGLNGLFTSVDVVSHEKVFVILPSLALGNVIWVAD